MQAQSEDAADAGLDGGDDPAAAQGADPGSSDGDGRAGRVRPLHRAAWFGQHLSGYYPATCVKLRGSR